MPRLTFQTKLLLGFVVTILIIILPLLYFVNTTIDQLSNGKIEETLQTSQKLFETEINAKQLASRQVVDTLLSTQASLRAVLASTESSDNDLFGGTAGPSKSALAKAYEIIHSSVVGLELFENPIVIFTDRKGNVLFNKTQLGAFGNNIKGLPGVSSSLEGKEILGFWSSSDQNLITQNAIPKSERAALYEVVMKPLTFGDSSVKGLMIVGYLMSLQTLHEIKNVTNTEIALTGPAGVFESTQELPTEALSSLNEKPSSIRFDVKGEDFIGLVSWLKDPDGNSIATSVVFKSKTREMEFYRGLKDVLNLAGLFGAIVAVLLALAMSRTVTRAVKELTRGFNEVRNGNLDFYVSIKTRDEFRDLADTFNNMTRGLREKEAIKRTFKKYVNPQVVSTLIDDEKSIRLGGTRHKLAFFFSDIAGFTKISEALSPEQVIEFLNQYLSQVTHLIENSRGIVDKYIGDAVMAYWTMSDPKETLRLACQSAIDQQIAITKLKDDWKNISALSKFGVRIGIHAGDAILGNIGSEERMGYTAIGDNVNATARLENLNKEYGTSILVTENVTEEVNSLFLFRELDWVLVAGKNQPLRIFELLNTQKEASASEKLMTETFGKALATYRKGNFKESVAQFQKIASEFPGDGPSQIFLKRCQELVLDPPANWNGIYRSRGKDV